ncbi:hypothetical protein [Zobellella maritima]|uniref:hypothetical protein n=1 Tax=Zobellella maritima TaxID=2059725 RepID=UPI000E305244|nr:hypothetical protein [Zobellella maritima]
MTEQNTRVPTWIFVLINHQVRQDAMAGHELWLDEIIAASSRFPGHQGVKILTPVGSHNQYDLAVRFAGQGRARCGENRI